MTTPIRIVRLAWPDGPVRYARVEGARAHCYDRPPWTGGRETGEILAVENARRLCPVEPRTIFGIGKNYPAHAREMGGDVPSEPVVFLKPTTTLLEPEGMVRLPRRSRRVDHEAELGVVIGSRCRHVSPEDAEQVIWGYTVLCDVTARDLQKMDGQWGRAKGFDTFCPAGPEVVAGLDPSALSIRLWVNQELRQAGNTADMTFDVAQLVAHISSFATLQPGDLIATGTPDGIGPLAPADRVRISIEDVGELCFGVDTEPE